MSIVNYTNLKIRSSKRSFILNKNTLIGYFLILVYNRMMNRD